MDHPLTHMAYDLVELDIASHSNFLDGESRQHERCLDGRHHLRHHIATLSFEDVCRLTDTLASVAGSTLSTLVQRKIATFDEVAEALDGVLRTTSDEEFVMAIEHGPMPFRLNYGAECECSNAPADRAYLLGPPTDPGVVLDNPCCEVCGEWAVATPDGFTPQEAAWWADWHIEREWAPFWQRAGWTPDEVRHLLRKQPRHVVAVQWALTRLDPRDALEHAYNGADPRDFLAHGGDLEVGAA